jgi:SAM-dependent methyltransferase
MEPRDVKLNLGSNDHRMDGYLSVDIAPPADVITDLRLPWPWPDSSVEAIYSHDCFEHLPQIHTMNEAWRVLRPGGKLDLAVPAVALADGRVNPGAFCDPTHVSFWSLDTRYYFCEEWNNPQGERGRLGPHYGIKALFRGTWKLTEYGLPHERRSKLLAILEAVK